MKDLTQRYSRQEIFGLIGRDGQQKIREARVLVVGCGALGSNIVNLLARAGVGFLRIVDRDIVELSNLQRQVMYDEEDVKKQLPKAEAAADHIRRINREIEVQAVVADVNPRSVPKLIDRVDLVLDGTDNFETRYLLNDLCVKERLPWIYGGVIGASGVSVTFVPEGPCLACIWPEPPETGQMPTCHTAGVLNTAPAAVAAIQVTEALKLIVGGKPRASLLNLELWEGRTVAVNISKNKDCPVCAKHEFRYLEAKKTQWATSLCGRDAVQISPASQQTLDLDALKKTLSSVGKADFNGFYLTAHIEGHQFTIFPDGRVMVHGTSDLDLAKSLHAKFIGS